MVAGSPLRGGRRPTHPTRRSAVASRCPPPLRGLTRPLVLGIQEDMGEEYEEG